MEPAIHEKDGIHIFVTDKNDVAVCSILFRREKQTCPKNGFPCTLPQATRTTCSLLRFYGTDDSSFYNSLPRLRPGKEKKNSRIWHLWRGFLFGFIYVTKQLVRRCEPATAAAATALHCSATLPSGWLVFVGNTAAGLPRRRRPGNCAF